MDNQKVENIAETVKEELKQSKYKIELSKPIEFEGNTIKELNLDGLEDISTLELMFAEKIYGRMGIEGIAPELTIVYAIAIAQEVTKYPFTFFEQLKAKDILKVKTMVSGFLLK